MARPSNFEQLMMELLNQARMDPKGEFNRYILSSKPVKGLTADITSALKFFSVNLSVYRKQLSKLKSVAPLAWNSALNKAATGHSELMIAKDKQEHVLPGESSIGDRVKAAGYSFSTVGENIFAFTETPEQGHAGLFIDWGNTSTGIQQPPGHRNNIMSSKFTEIGIGVIKETKSSTSVGPFVVTQDLANRSDYKAQFIGVVYTDKDKNNFYSMGEGLKKVKVEFKPKSGSTVTTRTASPGGYQKVGTAGVNTLTFSAGGLKRSVSARVTLGSDNVKVDLVNGRRIESSVDTVLVGRGARDLTLLGSFATDGTGNRFANRLTGNAGRNTLKGLGRNDNLIGGSGNDVLIGGTGKDRLTGGSGRDRYQYATSAEGGDTIVDFRRRKDKVAVAWGAFKGSKGLLNSRNFVSNKNGVARDRNDYYVFSTKTSTLFYDADGKRSGGKVAIATFKNKVRLRNTDIVVV